ncbi:MAG: hypothetical protein ACK5LO_06095 [Leucobacter sp.]
MSRPLFVLIAVLICAGAFSAMWYGWRARSRRDAVLAETTGGVLRGAVIASFSHIAYVATTPVASPFERVAIPGLSFKGFADLTVHSDGVSIAVTGEQPVHITAAQLRGTDAASSRVGKAVEGGGLALLRWIPAAAGTAEEQRELESSFRFTEFAEQRRFTDAVNTVINHELDHAA